MSDFESGAFNRALPPLREVASAIGATKCGLAPIATYGRADLRRSRSTRTFSSLPAKMRRVQWRDWMHEECVSFDRSSAPPRPRQTLQWVCRFAEHRSSSDKSSDTLEARHHIESSALSVPPHTLVCGSTARDRLGRCADAAACHAPGGTRSLLQYLVDDGQSDGL